MKYLRSVCLSLLLPVFCCCTSEELGTGGVTEENVVLGIGSSRMKTSLNPSTRAVTWNEGDEIAIWGRGAERTAVLKAKSSGEKVDFSGAGGRLDLSRKLFAFYPASSVSMQASGFSACRLANHSSQTGLLADFGTYQLCYTSELETQELGSKYILSCKDNPSNLLSVVKFTIKDGLDVREIKIEGLDDKGGPTNVAGTMDFDPSVPEITSVSNDNVVTISRGGEKINGDVYVFISPGPSEITGNCPATNRAAKLKFTFTNSEGKICEYTNFISSPLTAGVLTDLGGISRLAFANPGLYVVRGGERWAQLNIKRDIVKGSALDFSGFGIDAPAGKYGLLKAVGNHFEFTGKAGVPQYFYGANLTGSACAPDMDKADIIADRLARIGYNSVRFHHYDVSWEENAVDADGYSYRERMDWFASRLIEKGLYITMDMHTQRELPSYPVVKYKLFAVLGASLCGDSAAESAGYTEVYESWCGFVDSILDHTNKYTGRKWAEEPALIMVTVMNEPSLKKIWTEGHNGEAALVYAWNKCFKGVGAPAPTSVTPDSDWWYDFTIWLQTHAYENMRNYVRAKNFKSMLSVAYENCCYVRKSSGLSGFDVQDGHTYVDHPDGSPPSRVVEGRNPLEELPEYINPSTRKYKDILGQRPELPHTLTEWNHCSPNPLRALGAMLGSSYLRKIGWVGTWRFAYSESNDNYYAKSTPTGFGVTKDEVMKASEAGVVSFYLRGDITDPGSQLTYTDSEFAAVTDKSVVLYKRDMGTKSAGILTANTSISQATILLTSMDGTALENSGKMMLANITDCAGNGATYDDERKRTTISYGTGQYLRISKSDISIALSSPASYKVYELDTEGRRTALLPSSVVNGRLCFTVSVRGTDGSAHLYYEIVRE